MISEQVKFVSFDKLLNNFRINFRKLGIKIDVYRKRMGRTPLRIIVGSGGLDYEGWISTDKDTLDIVSSKDWKRYFSRNSISAILAEHVWEHLSVKEGTIAAKHCFEYLGVGGYLRIAVPDGFHPSSYYMELVRPGGCGSGASDHKVLYNYRTLRALFESIGFHVRLLEYFDEKNEFHYNEWDWREGMIRRSLQFDERNRYGQLNYSSIIIDAIKIS